jgi:hypothetical protein
VTPTAEGERRHAVGGQSRSTPAPRTASTAPYEQEFNADLLAFLAT